MGMTKQRDDGSLQYRLLIGGEWVDAADGGTFETRNPYTGEVWAHAAHGKPEDIDRAVRAARDAFEGEWSRMTATQRGHLLRRLGDVIKANADRIGEIETRDNGKLLKEMRGQLHAIPEWFYYFAGMADKIEGSTIPVNNPEMLTYTVREPLGVVGAIIPWNSPILLATFKAAPALAAGNTLVFKPAEQTPASILEFAALFEEAGFPPGVVNVVTGYGQEVGEALTLHPDVDKIAFTGSTATGIRVAQNCAKNLTRSSLELGGKSPNIIFSDADMENAVNGVIAGVFAATGQTCMAGSRLFLQEDIADEFLDRLVARAKTIKLGDPMASETEMGPVAFSDQLEKVLEYIGIGQNEGAVVRCGGRRSEDPALAGGLFVEPTVFDKVSNDMRIAQEEIFGPVVAAIRFRDDEEAVRLANQIDYGLAAGVWTSDVKRAHRVARGLKSGMVWINNYRKVAYSAPFGGYKMSGWGRENGFASINDYTQVKTVWVDMADRIPDPFKIL